MAFSTNYNLLKESISICPENPKIAEKKHQMAGKRATTI